MKKILCSLAIASLTMASAQIGAQFPTTQVRNEDSKWTFGGYAGLGGAFGNSYSGTSFYISPRAGYKVTEDLEVGLSGNFTLQNSKYFSSNMFGVGPFANYYFGRSFYLSGMFQEFFYSQKDKVYNVKYNGEESVLYLGGGYMQRIGNRAYMQIGAMYNVLYNENKSVFGGGFVPNVGIVYGL